MAIHESVSGFRGEIEDYKRKVRQSFLKTHRRIVFQVASRIIQLTPIDTGRAAASWELSIGFPSEEADLGPGSWAGAKEMAIVAARAVVERIVESNMFEKVYLNNTVPYIDYLEYGHSSQAPAGMVRIGMLEVRERIIGV
jgi:hypothetical protein